MLPRAPELLSAAARAFIAKPLAKFDFFGLVNEWQKKRTDGPGPKFNLHLLPLDIHVQHIFIYLTVEDIICLRRVNKVLFMITHEPLIWKRFLLALDIPVPPFRPSFQYTLKTTDYEIEQLVTRAISVDDNWRSAKPKILEHRELPPNCQVLDIALIPGSKYLIASMRSVAEAETNARHWIHLYHLDHPNKMYVVARLQTATQAFNLRAKYMNCGIGNPGIMVAFCQKRVGDDFLNLGKEKFIGEPEPDDYTYELSSYFITMKDIDFLSDPDTPNDTQKYRQRCAKLGHLPFQNAVSLETNAPLDFPTLFTYNDEPHLGMAQRGKIFTIINLTPSDDEDDEDMDDPDNKSTAGKIMSVECLDEADLPNHVHTIMAVRPLPNQKEVLVVRSVRAPDDEEQYFVEIYDMPSEAGIHIKQCTWRSGVEMDMRNAYRWFISCEISDNELPHPVGDQPLLPFVHSAPPPLSMFFRTVEPHGVVHYSVYPTYGGPPDKPRERRLYEYGLDYAHMQSLRICGPIRVIPGGYRSLFYSVDPDTQHNSDFKILDLQRYVNPDVRSVHYEEPIPEYNGMNGIARRPRTRMPQKVYSRIQLSPPLVEGKEMKGMREDERLEYKVKSGSVAAVAFDETTGRICIAQAQGEILILDMGLAVAPDYRFQRKILRGMVTDLPPGIDKRYPYWLSLRREVKTGCVTLLFIVALWMLFLRDVMAIFK